MLVPLLEHQVANLIDSLPRVADWVTGTAVPWIEQRFDVSLAEYVDPASRHRDSSRATGRKPAASRPPSSATCRRPAWRLLGFIANIALMPVLTFYFLRDWDLLVERVRELLPRPIDADGHAPGA